MNNMMKPIRFTGHNIPVTVAAKVMKKDQSFIREGLIANILPFGTAFKKQGSTQYDVYISPKLFYEYTGFFFDDDILDDLDEEMELKT